MNSLSWLIYAIQVVDTVRTFSFFILIGGFAIFAGWLFVGAIMSSEEEEGALNAWKKYAPRAGIVIALAAFLVIFVPSQRTMLLIAASQLGERFTTSDKVGSVIAPGIDLLKAWIKSETDRLTKRDKS